VFHDGSPCGRFYGLGNESRTHIVLTSNRAGIFTHGDPDPHSRETVFLSREDAVRYALEKNEALQSELTLEIGRLAAEIGLVTA